jgi:CubicO group peptidase (beta-lactamase class C family)
MVETQITGTVQPGFEGVRAAFIANFSRDGDDREIGAALAVYVRGRCMVDLWGGHRDAAETQPWARDTLINVWSASKGVVSIAVAMLVDQGRLSYDDKVASHWPEFAAGGKAAITVGQLVSHQSGLNGFAEAATTEDLFDWVLSTTRLASQTPFWEPGTAASYHAITHGFLVGELVRRVTGQDVGGFIRDALAGPLGADFHIGLPLVQDWRVGEIIGPNVAGGSSAIGATGQSEIAARAVGNPKLDATAPNRRDWRAAQIPAANGQSSAHGLGRVYAAIANGGVIDGTTVISPAGIERLRAVRHPGPDMLLGPRVWASGVSLNVLPNFGPHPETFGHSGWGGAYGCANVERGVGIGYVMNRMGSSLVGNPRSASLAAAVFAAVDG